LSAISSARKRRVAGTAAVIGVALTLVMLQSACGAGLTGGGGNGNPSQPGTAGGTYTVMLTTTEGTGNQSFQPAALPLTLTVQ
jgi:hypothetical protein